MPTYTDAKGRSFEVDKELTPGQIRQVFAEFDLMDSANGAADTQTTTPSNKPPVEENNLLEDIAEGTPAAPLVHPERTLEGMDELAVEANAQKTGMGYMGAVNPALPQMGFNAIKALIGDIQGEVEGYGTKMFQAFDADDTEGGIARGLQALLAATGNPAVTNAEKAIMEDDRHAAGRLGGNVLTMGVPLFRDAGKAFGGGATRSFNAAGNAAKSPMVRRVARNLPGRWGKVGRVLTDDISEMETLGPPKPDLPQQMKKFGDQFADELKSETRAAEKPETTIKKAGKSSEEPIGDVESPTKLEDIAEFPTRYKNVKPKKSLVGFKGEGNAPKGKEFGKHDPKAQGTGENPALDEPSSLDVETLKKHVSTEEAARMLEAEEVKKILPTTHEEWKLVNQMEEMHGLSREEAMKIVMGERRANPRSLGTNPRALGTNPRALADKRRQPQKLAKCLIASSTVSKTGER